MENPMRIAGVIKESIVDGPGIRFVLFFQGCPHKCEGCHNKSTWDIDGGYLCEVEKIVDEVKRNPLLNGITYSGGEPFLQIDAMLQINKQLSAFVGDNFNYMAYTGFTYEELQDMSKYNPKITEILGQLDYLVDGRFIEEKRDLTGMFKGSSNQRFIDLNLTEKRGTVIEMADN